MSSSFFKSVLERSLHHHPHFPHHPRPCGHFSLDFSCNVFPLYFGVGHSLFGSSAVAIGNSSSSEATWEQFGHTPQEVAPRSPSPLLPQGKVGDWAEGPPKPAREGGEQGHAQPRPGVRLGPSGLSFCALLPPPHISPPRTPSKSLCLSLSLFLKLYENTKHRSGSSESQSAQHCTQGWVLGFIYCESSV